MSDARREAFSRCPETCKEVAAAILTAVQTTVSKHLDESAYPGVMIREIADAAFDQAVEEGTLKLRGALIECEQELLTARRERDDVCEDRDSYRRAVEELESELEEARSERDALAAAQTG